ncbi:MAG: 6-bladed beta-propeller [Tannerella sp.]|jgi:hypothetical protein|nr:6-bladed beta-propeller [Tannerella sp.]
MRNFILVVLVSLGSYCWGQGNQLETIELSKSNRFENELKLSDLAEEVEYVPLETNEKCLIGNIIPNPALTDEYIFVGNLQFDRKGKFIRSIHHTGQGPNEDFIRCTGYDKKNRLIYMYGNYPPYKIIVYDFNGKLVKSINNPLKDEPFDSEGQLFFVHGIICDDKGNLVLFPDYEKKQILYKYVVMSPDGKIIHKEKSYDVCTFKERTLEVSSYYTSPFFRNESGYYLRKSYNDTIFRINPDYTCSAAYFIKQQKPVTLEESMKASAYVINYSELINRNTIYTVKDSKKYLYIDHAHSPYDRENRRIFFSLYDKQTRQLTANIKRTIQNDWDGGMDIENFYTSYMENSAVCFPLQPFEMQEQLTDAHFTKAVAKSPEKKKALQTLVKGLLDDDNPVLMIIKLK